MLHLLPPVGETNQNRHGKTNRNPTKHKQRPKLNHFSNILSQAQIVKKAYGNGASDFFTGPKTSENNIHQWKENLDTQDDKFGQKHFSKSKQQEIYTIKDTGIVPKRKQKNGKSKQRTQSRKESSRSYLPKPGAVIKQANKEQLSKTKGMNANDALFQLLPPPIRKVQNTNKQKLIKQTKPSQKPGLKKSSRQHSRQGKSYSPALGMEERKKHSQKTNEKKFMNLINDVLNASQQGE